MQVYEVNRVLKNGLERSKPGNLSQYWKYSKFVQEKYGLGVRTRHNGLGFEILKKEAQCRSSILRIVEET